MQWTERNLYNRTVYYPKKFHFFEGYIIKNRYDSIPGHYYTLSHDFREYSDRQWNTLNEAKAFFIKVLKKEFAKVDLKNLKYLRNINDIRYVALRYKEYPGNIQGGRYWHDRLWKKYHWIEGRFLVNNTVSNFYSIRFDITTPREEMTKYCIKILKRHIKRFLYYN